MNILNLIKFISTKNPKYSKDKHGEFGIPVPVENKGYDDEKGPQGLWVKRNKNSLVTQYITYVDGEMNGPFKSYYDGELRRSGNYKNGKQIGEWNYYSSLKGDNGALEHTENYDENGKPSGIWKYYYYGNNKVYRMGEVNEKEDAIGWWKYFGINGNLKSIVYVANMYNYFTIKRNEETGELEYSHNYNDKDNEIDEDRFNYFSRIYDIPKPDLNEL